MKNFRAVIYAVLAALLFGLNAPISKVLLDKIPPTLMASLLYLGAGFGMMVVSLVKKAIKKNQESHLSKKDLKYIILMVILDILAPISLMIGLKETSSAAAALLNNFEIVATALIALFVFKEFITKRLWLAIVLITFACIILSTEDLSSFRFSIGSIFVILACIFWGLENNCTRVLSTSDPLEVVVVKGVASGIGSLIIALILGFGTVQIRFVIFALVLGFVAYGMSIYFYVSAQRYLGASKTSAFYAFAPFFGVLLSFVIFRETPKVTFYAALVLMIAGAYFASFDQTLKKTLFLKKERKNI